MSQFGFGVLVFGLVVVTISLLRSWLKYRREEYIRSYRWPAELLERMEK